MKNTRIIKQTAVCLAISFASFANAATVVDTSKENYSTLQRQFTVGISPHSISSSADGLKVLNTRKDLNNTKHVRMQQTYWGFPVIGGYTIAHIKPVKPGFNSDAVTTMSGDVFIGLAADLGQPTKALNDAKAQALSKAKSEYADKDLSEEHAQIIVYLDGDNQARWAYRISFVVTHYDKIPERPTYIIDATDFKIMQKWNDMKTARRPVKGIGYGGNERGNVGKYHFGHDFPPLELTRDDEKRVCFMENHAVKVVDMRSDYYSDNKAMKFDCASPAQDEDDEFFWTGYDGDGLDTINGAHSPSNDAMYAGYVIKHMYHDWYGLEVLKKADDTPMKLVMRVHYGSRYENAFWDGKRMTFGDGGSWMYPLVSLGVGAHEISHGFTEQNSNLQYYGQSGGMNEAFSDMAAQAAEYYSDGTASWLIGERIMKKASGYEALRYMEKPSKDGRSIDTADDYYNGLDVHYSSGVFNHMFYLMANQKDWNARKAFDVMVKANQDYWTPYSNFKTGACGVLQAARDLDYELDGVTDIIKNEIKIDLEQCAV